MTGYWIDGWGGAPGGLFRRPMPPELALAGIDASLEVANRYIRVVYLPAIMDASSLRRRKAAWLSYRSPNGAGRTELQAIHMAQLLERAKELERKALP